MKNTHASFSMAARQWLAQLCFMVIVLPSVQVMAHETKHHKHGDAEQITHVMKAQFDRPNAPLKVHPVVVDGHFAVAGWLQGSRGGRALLVKADGTWSISVCGGDSLRDAKVLAQTGMGEAAAQSLAAKVQTAETKLSKSKLKQMALFQGEVQIDQSEAHRQAHDKPTHHPGQH